MSTFQAIVQKNNFCHTSFCIEIYQNMTHVTSHHEQRKTINKRRKKMPKSHTFSGLAQLRSRSVAVIPDPKKNNRDQHCTASATSRMSEEGQDPGNRRRRRSILTEFYGHKSGEEGLSGAPPTHPGPDENQLHVSRDRKVVLIDTT